MEFSWSDTKITPEALVDAAAMGMTGDLEAKVRDMLRHSTPFSHPQGNRRFGQAMLLVKDGQVQSIAPIEHDPVKEALKKKDKERLAAKRKARKLLT